MTAAMTSRGPDDSGTWQHGNVSFGHRRLAIIDLSESGGQPMVDESGAAIVFNGCVYNHRELRAELERAGHRFRSTSDTEVVLRAYREWGRDFVDRLVGMFAFAIFDPTTGCVVLVRDRLGIKPLYTAEVPGGLRFASSVPALLAGGGVDTELDPVALHHYLSWHSIVPAPRTILRGVRKLPPATVRTIHPDGRCEDRVYWQPEFRRRLELSPAEWQGAVLDSLRTAVERRMVADVPVGVLLSGGVDSSLIVALLAEAGAGDGLLTFSIGFDDTADAAGDEFRYSDLIARRYGTTHRRLRVPTEAMADAIAPCVAAMSEPMASHDVLAFYLLSEKVSEHVKVVQSGQGADEVFAGYDYYQPLAGIRRADAARAFVDSFTDVPHDEAVAALAEAYRVDGDVSTEFVRRWCAKPADSALDAVLQLELLGLMPDDPVKRVDNMTMAWGLEARVPFLDHDVVELAAAVPPDMKLAGGGKGILKDVARPFIGSEVVDRPKGYFPVPALSRLDGPLLDHVVDVLRSPAAKERGLVDPAYVDALLAVPDRRFPGNGDRLWLLGVLEMWLQTHGIDP
jgi:asparagine synthase (glutamine-hydrolysing)